MDKILVTQSSMPDYSDFCEEIKDIWDTCHLTNSGPKHQLLESKLCNYLKVPNISLFTNGHLALYTALKSLKIHGEVITTPFTFVSTVNAIVENGLKPVFCDINETDYTIDALKLESLINEKTCAILAVHVYGNVCNVELIEEIAKKYDLKVIYDAAHAFDVTYKDNSICNYGDFSMLSFHATKVFNTIEGGALIYENASLYNELKALKNFGIKDDGTLPIESINSKMNEFQAAMGLCNLRNINSDIKKRKKVYDYYITLLSNIKGIQLNVVQEGVTKNYSYFPILVDESVFGESANSINNRLKKNGIYSRRYFYPLITEYEFYKKLGYCASQTPIALNVSNNILCLPIYANLSLINVKRICDLILSKERLYE